MREGRIVLTSLSEGIFFVNESEFLSLSVPAMADLSSASTAVLMQEELDSLVIVCADISRLASRLRLGFVSQLSFSADHIKSSRHLLLSMCGHVEGSVMLLESLLRTEQQPSLPAIQTKNRYRYTREELLNIRQRVPKSLSIEIGKTLKQIIERESDECNPTANKSWRNIRTILA